MPLSFYGMTDDLGHIKTELVRLGREYPSLKRDARYENIMTNLEGIIAEFEAKNREFETDTTCEGGEWKDDNYQPCFSKETRRYTSGMVSSWYCSRHAPSWAKRDT